MRRWILGLVLVSALLALGTWGWTILFPGPERAIQKRLSALARALSVESGEGQISRLAKAQSLANFFAPDVEITVDVPGYHVETLQGRDELLQAALAARSRSGSLRVDIVDVNVAVGADGQSAEAHFTGKAQVSGERTLQAQEIKARLVKVNGDWLIRQVETVRTLR